MKSISEKEAVDYLRHYQQWRRGEIDSPQPNATKVGACLDIVIGIAERTINQKTKRKP